MRSVTFADWNVGQWPSDVSSPRQQGQADREETRPKRDSRQSP